MRDVLYRAISKSYWNTNIKDKIYETKGKLTIAEYAETKHDHNTIKKKRLEEVDG